MTIEAGAQLPTLTARITRADVVRYAGASTDFNPIHYSDRFAESIGLPGVVAHGMLTMGIALRAVTDWVGDPARVRSYSARFTKPVVVPDTEDGAELAITGTVSSVGDATLTITLDATCAGEKVLGAVRAEVSL